MRIYCPDCERYFDSSEIHYRRECMGEFWGSPAYDEFPECPYCHGDDLVTEDDMDFPPEYPEEEEKEDDE